jgi:hypothetical protein
VTNDQIIVGQREQIIYSDSLKFTQNQHKVIRSKSSSVALRLNFTPKAAPPPE